MCMVPLPAPPGTFFCCTNALGEEKQWPHARRKVRTDTLVTDDLLADDDPECARRDIESVAWDAINEFLEHNGYTMVPESGYTEWYRCDENGEWQRWDWRTRRAI